MNQNLKNKKRSAEKIPIISYILLGLALLSAVILIAARLSPSFAVFFNGHVGGAVRALLALFTNPLPFSLAELLIILLPVFITLLIIYAVNSRSKNLRSILTYFVTLISGVSIIFSLFVFSFGTGYHVPTLYERFEIEKDGVTTEELEETAQKLVTEINLRVDKIAFSAEGFSKMPYSLNEMNNILNSAFKPLSKKYDFVQSFKSNIKPVLMSVPMSYTHTTGVYSFFTGEANLNVEFPDYTLPYTAAHELAHQRGIARENEANFIAFLVCIESGNVYAEYSAYLNMFEYVAASLYRTDSEAYKRVYNSLSSSAKGEIAAYSRFYDKYRDSKAGEISSAINDAYLIANGTQEGTKSYGLVVDLAVAYFKGDFDEK